MYTPWFLAWLGAAVLSGVQFAVLSWGLWENSRFARARLGKKWQRGDEPRVALFAPCKGLEVGLTDNLRPLFEQEYFHYALHFIVESADDAVCPVLAALIAEYPESEARICVAGLASDTGQKVHNLRTASAHLADDIEVLAFVDSDACPRRDWLRRLVARLSHQRVGAVTGYRWFYPTRPIAAQALTYSINALVASNFGPGGHHLIWGGSWAIRRELFDKIDLRSAWHGTLSDDLVATRAISRAGARIEFEPTCMVTSPLDGGWRHNLKFIRRQYVIARIYVFPYWLLAFVGATLPVVTFWGGLVLAATGSGQQGSSTWLPAVVCTAYYAATLVRGYQRWLLARVYVPKQPWLMKQVACVDIWIAPLVALGNWLLIASSLFGNRLSWRGVDYRLARGGRVLTLERRGFNSGADRPRPDGLNVVRQPLASKKQAAGARGG